MDFEVLNNNPSKADFEVLNNNPSKEVNDFMNISMLSNYRPNDVYTDTNVILIEYDDFCADLYKSFKYNSQKILTLFKLDVPRETVIINGLEYNNPKRAFKEINRLVKTVKTRKILYMLCTQAVMFIPCYLLTKMYCHGKYYLGEVRDPESMIVDIRIDDDNNQSVDISKVLRIFYVDYDGDKTYSKIKCHMHIEFDQCVVLTWTTQYQ